MSYKTLLKMRCRILELVETQVDGLVSNEWAVTLGGSSVRCFLDLGFIRKGKDPIWTPDSKTAENRSGVLFLAPKAPGKPGDRVEMLVGPPGTFTIDSSMDEAWTPRKFHHLECFVSEVARVYTSGRG